MPLPADLIVGVAAGLALVAAMAWRWARHRRVRRLLAARLAAGDPAVRRAAISLLGTQGIGRLADDVLARVAVETDEGVLDELASTIRRCTWEPADRPALVELRMWAYHRATRTGPGSGFPAAVAAETTAPTVVSDRAAVAVDELRARVSAALGERVVSLRFEPGFR